MGILDIFCLYITFIIKNHKWDEIIQYLDIRSKDHILAILDLIFFFTQIHAMYIYHET